MVEAEAQLAADGEQRHPRVGGPDTAQRVDERVVGADLQLAAGGSGVVEGTAHPDAAADQPDVRRRVEAHQPAGRLVAAVRVGPAQAVVELVELAGGEQVADRADVAVEDRPGVERGFLEVVLRGVQRLRDLALREAADLAGAGYAEPGRAGPVVGGAAAGEGAAAGDGRHRAGGHQRYHGGPQLDGGGGVVGRVGVPEPHVDREAERDHDQRHHGDGLPGHPVRKHVAHPYGVGGVVQPFLGGELPDPGSPDEGLVEDDGPVLVFSPAGNALGRALGRVCVPAHITRLSLRVRERTSRYRLT